MNRILILIAVLFLTVVLISCGGEDEASGCVNENEERIVPCATDDTKKQDQKCASGEWVDDGICYLCKDNESRIINCAADKTRDQIQICYSDNWIDKGDCLCPESDKFCHSHDGLNWSDASSDHMTWNEALTYCKDLGGRLPTISELRTLIQNCPATETGGECGVTDDCLSFPDCWTTVCRGCDGDYPGKCSIFGDTAYFWTFSPDVDNTYKVWCLYFSKGYLDIHNKAYSIYVRCVR